MEIKNGGNIEGVVEFAGSPVPQDKAITLSSDVKYCGKERHEGKYLITGDNRIKNVVVFLEAIKAGKAIPNETVTVIDSKCELTPRVAVGFKGNKFIIENDDPVLHSAHVYAYAKGKTMYNIALPERGSTVTKTLTKTGLLELNCDCHPWMIGYVYVLDHPYATVTNENGKFTITDVPPGRYTVEAWHEALGTTKITDVNVEGGVVTKIKLQYNWKK
jgi:hypothetical protein